MRVKDIMMAKPSYCEPFWTVEAVAPLMDHIGTGILPVVEGVLNQKVLGVVTDRDLCVRVVAPGLYPAHPWIRDCMTRNPTCCRPDDDVRVALHLTRNKQVRRLPIVGDHMQLLGMLSISDLIRCHAVDVNLVWQALKRICAPHGEPDNNEVSGEEFAPERNAA